MNEGVVGSIKKSLDAQGVVPLMIARKMGNVFVVYIPHNEDNIWVRDQEWKFDRATREVTMVKETPWGGGQAASRLEYPLPVAPVEGLAHRPGDSQVLTDPEIEQVIAENFAVINKHKKGSRLLPLVIVHGESFDFELVSPVLGRGSSGPRIDVHGAGREGLPCDVITSVGRRRSGVSVRPNHPCRTWFPGTRTSTGRNGPMRLCRTPPGGVPSSTVAPFHAVRRHGRRDSVPVSIVSVRLFHGPYRMPKFRVGDSLECELRVSVLVAGRGEERGECPEGISMNRGGQGTLRRLSGYGSRRVIDGREHSSRGFSVGTGEAVAIGGYQFQVSLGKLHGEAREGNPCRKRVGGIGCGRDEAAEPPRGDLHGIPKGDFLKDGEVLGPERGKRFLLGIRPGSFL